MTQAEVWAFSLWVCGIRYNSFFVFSPVLREQHVTPPAHAPLSILRKGMVGVAWCSGDLSPSPAAKPRSQLRLAPAGDPGQARDLGVCQGVPGERTSLLVPALLDPRTS